MADFVAPQFQNPDLLKSYIQGQQAGQEPAFAAQQYAQGQQGLQEGGLKLDQLRQALQFSSQKNDMLIGTLNQINKERQGTPDASAPGGGTGGVQNGPQGALSQPGDNYGFRPSPMSQQSREAFGLLDPEGLKGMDEGDAGALKAAQLRAHLPGSPLVTLESFASNPNAGQALLKNPSQLGQWTQLAAKYGANAQDLSDINVRRVATLAANDARRGLSMDPLPMPEHFTNVAGPNGQLLQQDDVSGKASEVAPQKLPTYGLEKRWNPATGKMEGVMVQTSPGGAPAPSLGGGQSPQGRPAPQGAAPPGVAPQGAPRGGLGQVATAPVDLGYEKPTDTELKTATYATYARSSIPILQKMEADGYRMSPTVRTAVIQAATDDSDSTIKQWLSQETLAHKLSPNDQKYLTALMPFLQAAGHDMSGARLTTSALRQTFEANVPTSTADKGTLSEIANNRQQLYSGLLAGSRNAAQMPQFKDTLGADLANLGGKSDAATAAPAGAPKEGATSTSKSGKAIVFSNGHWQYK